MKTLLTIIFAYTPFFLFAQLGTNFHQSKYSFIGINYEFADRFRPEVRIQTDAFFKDTYAEFFSSQTLVEIAFTYDLINKEDYEFYLGAGLGLWRGGQVTFPIGVNMYPFENKNFGFHIEIAPLWGYQPEVLRGTWGIRYRFLRNE